MASVTYEKVGISTRARSTTNAGSAIDPMIQMGMVERSTSLSHILTQTIATNHGTTDPTIRTTEEHFRRLERGNPIILAAKNVYTATVKLITRIHHSYKEKNCNSSNDLLDKDGTSDSFFAGYCFRPQVRSDESPGEMVVNKGSMSSGAKSKGSNFKKRLTKPISRIFSPKDTKSTLKSRNESTHGSKNSMDMIRPEAQSVS